MGASTRFLEGVKRILAKNRTVSFKHGGYSACVKLRPICLLFSKSCMKLQSLDVHTALFFQGL